MANQLTQCQVAGDVMSAKYDQQINCCPNGPLCNQPAGLSTALRTARITAQHQLGVPNAAGIYWEIKNELPVGWRCEWDDAQQSAHFAVITAIRPGAVTHVDVADPWYGWTNAALDDLRNGSYLPQGAPVDGRWHDTYFINRPNTPPLHLFGRRLLRAAGPRPRRGGR